MKFLAVTTFNRDGYQRYGQRMIDSFMRFWPVEAVRLVAYPEGCGDLLNGCIDLLVAAPSVTAFRERHRENPKARGKVDGKYNYRFDAVRFCHKVFAIEAAARLALQRGDDALIWIDADTVTHNPVPADFVEGLLPEGVDVSYLARNRGHSETGFIVFRLRTPCARLIEGVAEMYRSGEVFELAEWHDAFVFDYVRRRLEATCNLKGHSLSGGFEHTNHPFINGPLGGFMDHLKGDGRKAAGRSRQGDLRVRRKESWWRTASFA